MTYSKALRVYLEHLRERGLSENTIHSYIQMLRRFDYFLVARNIRDLRNVTCRNLLDYANDLHEQNRFKPPQKQVSFNYMNDCARIAVRMFKILYGRELILTDITRNFPKIKNRRTELKNIPDSDQMRELLRQPNLSTPEGFRDRTILETFYSCALRISELRKLTVYDIDLMGGTLIVIDGKGKKDRVVPLGKIAARYLEEYIRNVRPKFSDGAEETLFLTEQGSKMESREINDMVKQCALDAHIPFEVTCHALRHACAVGMLRGGANIRYVQEMLGHSSIETTKIYTRLIPLDLKRIHSETAPSEQGRGSGLVPFDAENFSFSAERKRKKS